MPPKSKQNRKNETRNNHIGFNNELKICFRNLTLVPMHRMVKNMCMNITLNSRGKYGVGES